MIYPHEISAQGYRRLLYAADKYQDYMFGLIKRVIDEIGPRPSCSEAEKKLGRLLVAEWKPICDRVDVEPFTCSPTAFLGYIRFTALFYFAAVITYWFLPPLSLAMATISLSMVSFEFLLYREFVDFLFPRKQGENIIGAILPKSEPKRRVIVSAHMDSAYEFNLFYYLRNFAKPIVSIALVAVFIALGGSLAETIAYLSGFANTTAFTIIGFTMIVLTPVVAMFLFFHSYKPVPGASDDMAGIAIVTGLGKYLDEAKRNGDWYPEKTEVVMLATSSEEAGLRGAKRYVSKHVKELKATPTNGLFLETIYDEKYLTVTNREIWPVVKNDPELIKMAQDVAAHHNWPIAVRSIPLGGGGSDAAAFSVKGISSICLLCQDISLVVPNYHTRDDTYEHIRPESLSVMLQLVIDMIQRIDKR